MLAGWHWHSNKVVAGQWPPSYFPNPFCSLLGPFNKGVVCHLQMGLQTLHMHSSEFFLLLESWKSDILRPPSDFVDKDNIPGDGGKTRRKEPGTPNEYVEPSSLHIQTRAVSWDRNILEVTILLALFVTEAHPFPLPTQKGYFGYYIPKRKGFCGQISLGDDELNKSMQTSFCESSHVV